MSLVHLLLASAIPAVLAWERPDGVGRLPALGWNSWNAYACDITEENFLDAAQQLADLGLQAAGYEYVNIDDCWLTDTRDSTTGRQVPDPNKFPDGIDGLAAKVHALGLKIGIYSSAGTATCQGLPASLGYESIDAAAYAEWGVDYLKYDNCNVPSNWTDNCNACVPDEDSSSAFVNNGTCTNSGNWCPDGYDYSQSNTAERYRIMQDAIEAQNHTILYSLCEWGQADVQTWGNATANSWRATGDISASWTSILQNLNANSFYLNYVDFWGHSDADMLEIGNGGLTIPESRSHFALWAGMKCPLLIGTYLGNLSQDAVEILKNEPLLAFHQDSVYGKPAQPYKWGINPDWTFNVSYPAEYWSGQYSNGTVVMMLNTLDTTVNKTATWSEIPGLDGSACYDVFDAWTGESLGTIAEGIEISVEAHDTAVIVVQESS